MGHVPPDLPENVGIPEFDFSDYISSNNDFRLRENLLSISDSFEEDYRNADLAVPSNITQLIQNDDEREESLGGILDLINSENVDTSLFDIDTFGMSYSSSEFENKPSSSSIDKESIISSETLSENQNSISTPESFLNSSTISVSNKEIVTDDFESSKSLKELKKSKKRKKNERKESVRMKWEIVTSCASEKSAEENTGLKLIIKKDEIEKKSKLKTKRQTVKEELPPRIKFEGEKTEKKLPPRNLPEQASLFAPSIADSVKLRGRNKNDVVPEKEHRNHINTINALNKRRKKCKINDVQSSKEQFNKQDEKNYVVSSQSNRSYKVEEKNKVSLNEPNVCSKNKRSKEKGMNNILLQKNLSWSKKSETTFDSVVFKTNKKSSFNQNYSSFLTLNTIQTKGSKNLKTLVLVDNISSPITPLVDIFEQHCESDISLKSMDTTQYNIPLLNEDSACCIKETVELSSPVNILSFTPPPDQTELCNEESFSESASLELMPCGESGALSTLSDCNEPEVFESIEISTPDLELELGELRESSDFVSSDADYQVPIIDANKKNIPDVPIKVSHKNYLKCGQNNLPLAVSNSAIQMGSCTSLVSSAITRERHQSCSSNGSKSSYYSDDWHHSSSSDHSHYSVNDSHRSKFRNCDRKGAKRPVKYDKATKTLCDEFGREIRPHERHLYLNSPSHHSRCSSRSDSHSHRSSAHDSHDYRHRRSRSRSRTRSKYPRSHTTRHRFCSERTRRSPSFNRQHEQENHVEYVDSQAMEDRRVLYVGKIPQGFSVEQLKQRFEPFGKVEDAIIKTKTTSSSIKKIYGFVTFSSNADVVNAMDNGNNDPLMPKFELNFGGRRKFCNGNYTDLDGKVAEAEGGWYSTCTNYVYKQSEKPVDDYATLLQQEQIRRGISVKGSSKQSEKPLFY